MKTRDGNDEALQQAAVQNAEANLLQLKAKLYQAERDWGRARKLGPSDALSQAEKQILLQSLENCNWNRQRCAQSLGISRTTLFNKMRRFSLVDPRRHPSAEANGSKQ